MSPDGGDGEPDALGFPRVSGDEPRAPQALALRDEFSPRERG